MDLTIVDDRQYVLEWSCIRVLDLLLESLNDRAGVVRGRDVSGCIVLTALVVESGAAFLNPTDDPESTLYMVCGRAL